MKSLLMESIYFLLLCFLHKQVASLSHSMLYDQVHWKLDQRNSKIATKRFTEFASFRMTSFILVTLLPRFVLKKIFQQNSSILSFYITNNIIEHYGYCKYIPHLLYFRRFGNIFHVENHGNFTKILHVEKSLNIFGGFSHLVFLILKIYKSRNHSFNWHTPLDDFRNAKLMSTWLSLPSKPNVTMVSFARFVLKIDGTKRLLKQKVVF